MNADELGTMLDGEERIAKAAHSRIPRHPIPTYRRLAALAPEVKPTTRANPRDVVYYGREEAEERAKDRSKP